MAAREDEYFRLREEQLEHRLRREHGLSRRELLRLGAAGALALATGPALRAVPARAQAAAAGPAIGPAAVAPIVKPLPPEWFIPLGTNAEMRWEAMRDEGVETPAAKFFVRNHTATPVIDAATWRLRVFGSGLRRPEGVALSLDDLLRLPARTVPAFIECAGNGRRLFGSQQDTPAPGSAWTLGAVGVARWRGVPLREVLERAGITAPAVDVMPEGLDATVVAGGADQGHVRRPLPVAKALDDVLLAYEMNGAPLPPDHGHPVRLVVPGWVGIASVKWLGRIEVADRPLYSYWNTAQYRMVGPSYPADTPPLGAQQVKSAFELPWGGSLPGGRVTLTGRSWSGGRPIRTVEVRVDGPGGTAGWQRARLHGPNREHAWVRWSLDVDLAVAGAHELRARATDRDGTAQPDIVPFNANGYQFWAVARHPVTVA